jgi:hypothetical protein
MAFADSARAVPAPAPAASIAAVSQTAKPPADRQRHTNDSSFDPGKVSSSLKPPQASPHSAQKGSFLPGMIPRCAIGEASNGWAIIADPVPEMIHDRSGPDDAGRYSPAQSTSGMGPRVHRGNPELESELRDEQACFQRSSGAATEPTDTQSRTPPLTRGHSLFLLQSCRDSQGFDPRTLISSPGGFVGKNLPLPWLPLVETGSSAGSFLSSAGSFSTMVHQGRSHLSRQKGLNSKRRNKAMRPTACPPQRKRPRLAPGPLHDGGAMPGIGPDRISAFAGAEPGIAGPRGRRRGPPGDAGLRQPLHDCVVNRDVQAFDVPVHPQAT